MDTTTPSSTGSTSTTLLDGVDVDAWLDQARPPMRSVTVYGRSDLYAQIQDLRAEADRLDAQDLPGDTRPGRSGDDARARAAELAARIESSRLVLHVRGALLEERLALGKKHDDEKTDDADAGLAYTIDLVAACLVDPGMTATQVTRLRRKIGEAQWRLVVDALEDATREPISVPLSLAGSAPRSTPAS